MDENISDYLTRAAGIRDASEDAENTAFRVGSLLVDVVNTLNEHAEAVKDAQSGADTASNGISALKAADALLQQQLDGIAIRPFSGLVYDATEALQHPAGSILYSVKEGLFFHVDTSGQSISKHNAYHVGDMELRGDMLFRCGSSLYAKGADKKLTKLATAADMDSAIETAKTDMTESTVAEVRRELLGGLRLLPLSEAQYEALAEAGELKDDTIYMTYEDDTQQ